MANYDFYNIDKTEKEAVFNAIAAEMGMPPLLLKKTGG